MRCITVFGGTGFLGRRVVRHLRESGAALRIASRHPGRAEDDGVERIAADAHDEHSVEAAVDGADGVVNAVSLYVEHGSETFRSVHVKAAARVASAARRAGVKRLARLGSLEVDDEIKFGRLLYWQITRLRPAQNLVDIVARAPELLRDVCSIG